MSGPKKPDDDNLSRHLFTEAEAHLTGIYLHIADKASPTIAARFTAAIVDYCEAFKTFPHRGTKRDDLRPGLRTVGFRRSVTIAFSFGLTLKNVRYVGIVLGNIHGFQVSPQGSEMSKRAQKAAHFARSSCLSMMPHNVPLS